MEKFYCYRSLSYNRSFSALTPNSKWLFQGRIKIILLLCLCISLPTINSKAQDATFYENFDDTELGELPLGWTWYDNDAEPARWQVTRFNFWGPRCAFSGMGAVEEGVFDEDWLITPQIIPTTGDHLIFDVGKGNTIAENDVFRVLLSTTTADAPVAFTETLATYSALDISTMGTGAQTVSLDLSAYTGTPVYIAFVHETTASLPNEFYVDNVWVRGLRQAEVFNPYMVFQNSGPGRVGYSPYIAAVNINVVGDEGTVKVTSFSFTTAGSTHVEEITGAELHYSFSNTFYSPDDPASFDVFGSVVPGEGSFTITGDIDLPPGNNYFWLVYSYRLQFLPEYPYPSADATFESVVVDGTAYDPTVTSMEGAATIVPNVPPNDDIADAFDITAYPARYGGSTVLATPEINSEETLAYCAFEGLYDGSNSIWWRFVVPADGWITADLSETNFNCILVVLNSEMNQIACSDDIDPAQNLLQSRISDFPVTGGDTLWLRVSGAGHPAIGGEQGIAVIDFNFTVPLGVEEEGREQQHGHLYPNPATTITSVDFDMKQPGNVTVAISDALGRAMMSENLGFFVAGKKHTVSLDVSMLPSGTYLLHINDDKSSTRKLIIAK